MPPLPDSQLAPRRPRPLVCSPTRNAVPAGAASEAASQARSEEEVATSTELMVSWDGVVIGPFVSVIR